MKQTVIQPLTTPQDEKFLKETDSERIVRYLHVLNIEHGSPEKFSASLPFSINDTTAGSENELQTVVVGTKEDVDLPIFIESSSYYKNLHRHARAEEFSHRRITELEDFINGNSENIWENSWVRFPYTALSAYAGHVLNVDFHSDKKDMSAPYRTDTQRFSFNKNGKKYIRIPVSYLLKLSLADAISTGSGIHTMIKVTGERLMHHFLNDNTSPEQFSFFPVHHRTAFMTGMGLAKETAKRFVLTQLLIQYANRKFRLEEEGQKAMIYFASHPPVRQKALNDIISDTFYRQLFMSPCLSGWDKGEDKWRYMRLCHRVLSRSQINAVSRLRDAGIITSNLVVLPNISNISLANNGTHVSLGSRKLTALLKNRASGFDSADEKYLGDLSIKIVEHFLPLFVGCYSAAPYRIDFRDFHPEKVLSFLPHQLDYTHLRMIWRRWKKKAKINVLAKPLTPFGPEWLDKLISRTFALKGDLIPDYRLIDYLTALLSTDESPALNGNAGNGERLLKDLKDLGIFDTRMPLYQLYRLREFSKMGFNGFEGRYYSVFESIMNDMGMGVGLQTLLNALAYKYILTGEVRHQDIPDVPFVESERRQIFFGKAIGIPTFFVRKDTRNHFLRKILKKAGRIRSSTRYPGYSRVYNIEYCRALIRIIREDAAELIEILNLSETIRNLENRIDYPQTYSASGRLNRFIRQQAGITRPMKLSGIEFNSAVETCYRNDLRKRHIQEGLKVMEEDFGKLDMWADFRDAAYKEALDSLLKGSSASAFFTSVKKGILEESLPMEEIRLTIHLLILSIHADIKQHGRKIR